MGELLNFFDMVAAFVDAAWTFFSNFISGVVVFVVTVTESVYAVGLFSAVMPSVLSGSVLAVGFIGAIKAVFGR